MTDIPSGGPYFSGPGEWSAYLRWSFSVPCRGCGKRKMDNPKQYGLQPDPSWPDFWVTEDWCNNCWWSRD